MSTSSIRKKQKFLLFICSCILSFVFLEISLRFLGVHKDNKVKHEILEYTMDPSLSSIDANGFRNPQVVSRADIVALGDSHTYGYNAPSEGSWPQQLSKMSKKQVYNFGVSGYGILHYHHLLDQAIALQPKIVVVGVLFSNDLYDIVKLIIRRPYWRNWCKERQYYSLLNAIQSVENVYIEKEHPWYKSTAISIAFENVVRPKILHKIFPKKHKGFYVNKGKNKKFFKKIEQKK